jgi:hypothetical protein
MHFEPVRQAPDRAQTRFAAGFAVALGVLWMGGCGDSSAGGGPLRVSWAFGEVGRRAGQFSYPRAIDTDGRSLFIVDKLARVQRLDPRDGASLGEWRMPEWEHGKPVGLCVWAPAGAGAEPLVFVPDTHYYRVMVYRCDPPSRDAAHPAGATLVTSFGAAGTGPGQFLFLTDVAVLPSADGARAERLYVSEYGGNDRISIWDLQPDGGYAFVRAFGAFGASREAGAVEFNRPQSIALDLDRRELIVADACNHRIGRLDLDGKLIAWLGGEEAEKTEFGRFQYPYGLALLGDGTVMVSEFGGNRLQRVDLETGESLGVYGRSGDQPGELMAPWGVAALGGHVFALDSGNNRVTAFEKPRAVRGRLTHGGGS